MWAKKTKYTKYRGNAEYVEYAECLRPVSHVSCLLMHRRNPLPIV
jgi:hypothetical protein